MKKELKENYWVCIIGPADSKDLEPGADFPMRQAVNTAFVDNAIKTNEYNYNCWSGWGASKEKVNVLNAVWSLEETDALFIAIKSMLKGSERLS